MDDELTPQESERVRRLLADARHTEPIPDDVAARIDRALADLAPEPAAGTRVVPLAQRRRKAGRLLLAAAAVVVGGVAVGQVVGGGSGDDEAATTASEAEDQGLEAPDRDSGSTSEDPPPEGGELPGAVADSQRSLSKLATRELRSDRFARDAARLQALVGTRRAPAYSSVPPPPVADSAQLDECPPGVWGGGRYVRVAFDDAAGWLVYRPPRGDTQVVDLFLCGEDSPERSATLPFR